MTGSLSILLLQLIKAISLLFFFFYFEEVFKYLEEQAGKLEAKMLIEFVELCYRN